MGHFKRVKKGFRSIGLQVESSQVGLTRIFHMNLFYIYIYIYIYHKGGKGHSIGSGSTVIQ